MMKDSTALKRLITSIAFALMLAAALWGLTHLLEDKISYREKGDYFSTDTDYDVIFFGVSHMWNGVLPMEMWQEFGISSYNWGYSNSTPAINYYLLQEVLKKSDPKVVVLDINGVVEYEDDGNGKYDRDSMMQAHVEYDRFPISVNKIRAAIDVFDDYDGRADFIWDFILYHNRWDHLTREDFGGYVRNRERGARFLDGISHADIAWTSRDERIDNLEDYTCYQYFIRTIELCRDRGIPVLCTCLPHICDAVSQRVCNTIGDKLVQYDNCSYYNMLYDDLIAYSIDTHADGGHVNYAGACKTTSRLGEYLKNNYDLPDRSEDPEWIAGYADYLNLRRETLAKQDMFLSYLMLLKNPGLTVDIEFYDENMWYSQYIGSEVYFAGVTPATLPVPDDIGERLAQSGAAVPESGVCAHTVLYSADGSIYDEAYWMYDQSIESSDIGDMIVRIR